MRLNISDILDMIVGQDQLTEESQTEAHSEVGQATVSAAEVLDVTNVLEDFFIHQQQFVVTQIQMFQFVKFVENSWSEFLDVVVI